MRNICQTAVLLIAAMGAGYVGGLMSQIPQRADAQVKVQPVVRAKSFELVDDAGKLRGIFEIAGGQPRFILFDATGVPRGTFVLMNGAPALLLRDTGGEIRGSFALSEEGDRPLLSLVDTDGKQRGVFGLNTDGEASISLFDKAAVERGRFFSSKYGASLRLFDVAGTERTILGACSLRTPKIDEVTVRPEASLLLFDKDGKTQSSFPQ